MTSAVYSLRYLFLSTFVLASSAENSPLMTTESFSQTAKTAECVLKLSAKYFVNEKALSGSIVVININSYSSPTQTVLLHTVHAGAKYSIMVKDSSYPHANASHFREKAKNYMLILEDKLELNRNILQLNDLPTWNPLAKTIVFYQLHPEENGEKVAMGFINELYNFKLLKSIILIHDSLQDEVVSYSWTPYTESNCGGKCDSLYVLDRCKKSYFEEVEKVREMFPHNMKSCPLMVQAVVAEPYVMQPAKRISKYANIYQFDEGAEINLVKIIAEFTNMSLYLFMSERDEDWGTVDRDGSATGAYSALRNDTIDLVIGNVQVMKPLRKWFDPTVSYTQDEMTWCVRRAEMAATWDNLIIIFQWPTWIATIFALIAMGLIFHLLYTIENRRSLTVSPVRSILVTFNMMLGWTTSFKPKSATFRILIFSWLYFSFNMGISYEALLRTFLMHPRFEKQISSESDLIKSGLSFGGREIYRNYFENSPAKSYLYLKYNSTTFSEGIRRAVFDRNFAVVSSRRQAEYQNQKLGKGTRIIYCFPESDNLYKYGVVLLARKWFPMIERFNRIIRSVTENGLIEKWNKELFIHRVRGESLGTIVPLNLEHLFGAFAFIGVMYAVSSLVFIGEIVLGYIGKRKRALPFK